MLIHFNLQYHSQLQCASFFRFEVYSHFGSPINHLNIKLKSKSLIDIDFATLPAQLHFPDIKFAFGSIYSNISSLFFKFLSFIFPLQNFPISSFRKKNLCNANVL